MALAPLKQSDLGGILIAELLSEAVVVASQSGTSHDHGCDENDRLDRSGRDGPKFAFEYSCAGMRSKGERATEPAQFLASHSNMLLWCLYSLSFMLGEQRCKVMLRELDFDGTDQSSHPASRFPSEGCPLLSVKVEKICVVDQSHQKHQDSRQLDFGTKAVLDALSKLSE